MTLWIMNVRSRYHFYYTDQMSDINEHLQHDCLVYFVRNDILQYQKSTELDYQIVFDLFTRKIVV
jgi:hypothetical protein